MPEDITPEEVGLLNIAAVNLYQELLDPIDKFIVAFVYELGYSKFDCAQALCIHPSGS